MAKQLLALLLVVLLAVTVSAHIVTVDTNDGVIGTSFLHNNLSNITDQADLNTAYANGELIITEGTGELSVVQKSSTDTNTFAVTGCYKNHNITGDYARDYPAGLTFDADESQLRENTFMVISGETENSFFNSIAGNTYKIVTRGGWYRTWLDGLWVLINETIPEGSCSSYVQASGAYGYKELKKGNEGVGLTATTYNYTLVYGTATLPGEVGVDPTNGIITGLDFTKDHPDYNYEKQNYYWYDNNDLCSADAYCVGPTSETVCDPITDVIISGDDSGAWTQCGPAQVPNVTVTFNALDATPPVVTLNGVPDTNTTNNSIVNLTCVDNETDCTIFYNLDNNNEGAFTQDSNSVDINLGADGVHFLAYYSENGDGVQGTDEAITITLDTIAPTLATTVQTTTTTATIDINVSEFATIRYDSNTSALFSDMNASLEQVANLSTTVVISELTAGTTYTYLFGAQDAANNISYTTVIFTTQSNPSNSSGGGSQQSGGPLVIPNDTNISDTNTTNEETTPQTNPTDTNSSGNETINGQDNNTSTTVTGNDTNTLPPATGLFGLGSLDSFAVPGIVLILVLIGGVWYFVFRKK